LLGRTSNIKSQEIIRKNETVIVAGGAIPEMKDYEPKTKKKERQ
jgi:hypothetical protein